MSDAAGSGPPPGQVHQEATASENATVNQAGRDLHVHHEGGVRRVQRGADGPDAACPYPGLAAFTGYQAEWFYGRDRVTADLLARLDAHVTRGGPVMVVAPSGAGKSSLLHAGLLHEVARGCLPAEGSREWPRIAFSPGARPLREAAAALKTATGEKPAGPGGDVPAARDLDDLLRRLLGQCAAGHADRVVIVVDQFEELFTLCDSDAERREFITWLWHASGADEARDALALVVCGLRADFYAQCVSSYPELRRSLQADQVVLGPMSEEELRQAIRLPSEAAGLEVEPGLTELLLADLRTGRGQRGGDGRDQVADYDAGRLPLLAHALRVTWQQRHGSVLTVDGYRDTGGIANAIQASAERVYASLDESGQRAARVMFLRLVKVGASIGEDARRRVTRADLTSGSPAVAAALDAYVGSRLVTMSRDAAQITHEALLTAWPRLRGWLEDDRAANRQGIEDAAAEWERASGDASLLYRGSTLEKAAQWAGDHSQELTGAARRFLAASRRHARRAAVIRNGAVTLLAVLALAAVSFAGVAQHNAANANRQHAVALSRQLAAESLALDETDLKAAGQLATAAWQESHTNQAKDAMLTAVAGQQEGTLPVNGTVRDVVFSPDGKLLATGDDGGTMRLWDPVTGQPVGKPITGGADGVRDIAFSPDGRLLATGDADGTVQLRDPLNRRPAGKPITVSTASTRHPSSVWSVVFSPDGRLLATSDDDGIMRLWDPVTGQPIGKPITGGRSVYGRTGRVGNIAFSPDGRLLATGDDDGTARLWDPVTGQPVGKPIIVTGIGTVFDVVFSPDSKLLATSSQGGTAQLWNTATGQPVGKPLPVSLDGGGVLGVAFSPDGKVLATADGDGTARLWNTATGQPVGQPIAASSGSGVEAVAFSPDGKVLATADSDGTARLWNTATGPGDTTFHPVSVFTSRYGVNSVAFSPDGKVLATADQNGIVRLLDPLTGHPVGKPIAVGNPANGSATEHVTFSPDGKLLATADQNGTIQLWDPVTGRPAGNPIVNGGYVMDVAFSPNGKLLATEDEGGIVRLWDPATSHPLGKPLTKDTDGFSVAFSPDGKLLATTYGFGDVRLWDLATRHPVGKPIPAATNPSRLGVNGVAFSPDGKLLATADSDGTTRLWSTATGQNISGPLPAGTGNNGVDAVAFSPDGKLLATADDDDTVRLWDPATGQLIGKPPISASTETRSNQSGFNSVAFSPDGNMLATTAANGDVTVRLWGIWLFRNPYQVLCADFGAPAQGEWAQYAPGEPLPKVCS